MINTHRIQYKQWLFKFLLILTGTISQLYANSPYRSYSVADGMANSTIKAISQDSEGYVWFGTRNGLIRFDGYEFRNYIYETEKENSVYSNDITCITKDNRGWLWIGTFNWILLFNPFTEKFVELELEYPHNKLPEGVVTNIWIDRNEKIWVSSKTGLYLLEDNKVKSIEELDGAYINAMDACDWESLIMEVTDVGTAIYNIRHNKLEYIDESNIGKRPVFYKIFRDSKGQVWLGADKNNIFTYRPQTRKLEQVKIKVPEGTRFDNDQVHDILEYNDSILIVGTDNGLLAFNCYTHVYSENSMRLLQASLLKNNRVMCLHKDHQEGFWVGTFGKSVKYYNPAHYYFNYYDLKTEDNLPLNIAGNLAEKDGFLYIGHQQGLAMMNMKTGEASRIDLQKQLKTPNDKPELFHLYQKSDDRIYFHLLNWGLHAFDLNQNQIIERLAINPISQVRSMAKDRNGHLWIAEEKISIYDPITRNIKSNLSTNFNNISNFMLVQDILLCKNGDMMLGTRTSGAWIYPWNEDTQQYEDEAIQLGFEPLKNKNINVLFEDSKGNIWIGTYSSGLYKCNLQTQEYTFYNTANGLVHNSIYDILEDEKSGDMWIAALNGISRINTETGKIFNYTNKTGFPLQEIPRKAFFKGSNGLFYIGGNNGLVSFDPVSFRKEPTTLSGVKISLIESINKKEGVETPRFDNSEALQNVEFPFNHSSILINFSALNYFFPQGIQYAYKLDGLEDDWRYTERNEAIYSNLSEGTYTFMVRASDHEGTWSDEITELKITIHPPLWRTPWAKFIYSLLILGLLYFILSYFNHRKTTKYKQQINKIEKENLEKYYQMKLELFTKFSHELRTPLTLITGPTEDLIKDDTLPEKLSYPLRMIHKNASRLLLLVNRLMDFRKMEHGSMTLKISQVNVPEFVGEQVESFIQLASKRGIQLSYVNEFNEENIWFDVSLMEKVILNLLSNAIKHTPPTGEILVTSRKEGDNLIISVRDNGEGISEENLEKIFGPFFQVQQGDRSGMFGSGIGLNLAQYVVSLHKGIIRVESALGKGSEFFVQLPLGSDHFKDNPELFIISEPELPTAMETEVVPQISLEKSIMNQLETEVPDSFVTASNKTWILVAEDDEDLRHYIVNILSDEYGIIQAEDGKNGLALALDKIPDLIISDVQMPLMNGIEFCKQVKDDLRTAHIPVILLTALTHHDNIREGYEAMADDYILKPFDSELLRVRVKNLLDNRNQLREIFSKELISIDIPAANLNPQDAFMEKLMELIKSRAENPELSINDLCVEMGVSRAQLFRKIKAVSDISPNKLIQNIRMKMAVTYLKTKQFTVTEVAYKVGFSDPTYFSKTFKSVFNITPTEFMKGV